MVMTRRLKNSNPHRSPAATACVQSWFGQNSNREMLWSSGIESECDHLGQYHLRKTNPSASRDSFARSPPTIDRWGRWIAVEAFSNSFWGSRNRNEKIHLWDLEILFEKWRPMANDIVRVMRMPFLWISPNPSYRILIDVSRKKLFFCEDDRE